MIQEQSIQQLNSFLRGELAAVETYRQALEKVSNPSITTALTDCLRSHQQRVEILERQITQLGGQPSVGAGAWGKFTKLVQGGANVLGSKATIAALEEGEDLRIRDYRDLSKLDPASRTVVEQQVVPLAQASHQAMSSLKRQAA
jgi:uncharacterized protein (TIGR02284 family)